METTQFNLFKNWLNNFLWLLIFIYLLSHRNFIFYEPKFKNKQKRNSNGHFYEALFSSVSLKVSSSEKMGPELLIKDVFYEKLHSK